MKSIYLFYFIKILYVRCTSVNNLTSKLIRLDDLNSDVILDIFDHFQLEDLINVAELNSKFRELIAQYYSMKFHIHEKVISLEHRNAQKIHFDDDLMPFYDPKLFAKVLRIFGQSISRIKINHSYNSLIEILLRIID